MKSLKSLKSLKSPDKSGSTLRFDLKKGINKCFSFFINGLVVGFSTQTGKFELSGGYNCLNFDKNGRTICPVWIEL